MPLFAMPAFAPQEILRASCGSLLGLLTALVLAHFAGLELFATLAASAALIFAVPNSPLSQPTSVIGGQMLSLAVGFAVALVLPAAFAAPLAGALALAAMMSARLLHPPGAATAFTAAFLGASWQMPAGLILSLLCLLVIGALYNRATGRKYPFRAAPAAKVEERLLGLPLGELQNILTRFNQGSNLGAADLGRMLSAAEEEARRLRFSERNCASLMASPPIFSAPEANLQTLVQAFIASNVKSMPVLDAAGRPLGVIDRGDLLAAAPHQSAAQIMKPLTALVAEDAPVGTLIETLAHGKTQFVGVMSNGKLVGVITRTDILRLMLEQS